MDTVSEDLSIDKADVAKILLSAPNEQALFRAIVDTPFQFKVETTFLFLGIIVLLQLNPETNQIDRVALSNTELAKLTTDVSAVPFSDIKIDADNQENIIAAAIRTGEAHDTTDWKYLFTPALTSEEARLNQANAGIAYSAVYPLPARSGGAMIFSYFQYKDGIGKPQAKFMKNYSQLVTEALAARQPGE